jgi:cell division protein FtsW (lipid II flippase)
MDNSIKILHWAPRLLCVLAIGFISLFALDAFDQENTLGEQLADFLMHMIPSLVLSTFLLLAWKWEKIGGVIFILIGLIFTPIIFLHNYRMNNSIWISLSVILMITIPFVIVGILFLLSHYRKKKLDQAGEYFN